jgi:hypothetical protein
MPGSGEETKRAGRGVGENEERGIKIPSPLFLGTDNDKIIASIDYENF